MHLKLFLAIQYNENDIHENYRIFCKHGDHGECVYLYSDQLEFQKWIHSCGTSNFIPKTGNFGTLTIKAYTQGEVANTCKLTYV
jgi:hypothetical protein